MKTEDTEVLVRELNQARSKPDTVDRPVRTARIFVHHYNSTQCKVVPPSESNEHNLPLLSSVPESETERNAPEDLGRPLTDFCVVSSVW